MILPPGLEPWLPVIAAKSRGMGRRIVATRGGGKTRLTGRLLLPADLCLNVPIIAVDPAGELARNVYDWLDRQAVKVQRRIAPRLRYVNVAGHRVDGSTYVTPFPLLYRVGDEPLQEIAVRPLETWRMLNPGLRNASVQGWPPLARVGSYLSMLLYGMDPPRQLTEGISLLDNPAAWRREITAARDRCPDELAEPASYFLDTYPNLRDGDKRADTAGLRNMLQLLNLNPVARAMYGADTPGLTLEEIVENRLCVILDFHRLPEGDAKQLAVLWLYRYFMDAFVLRGPSKDKPPISFFVDEASYVLPSSTDTNAPLREYFIGFIQRYMRNNNICLTIIHQEPLQFDDGTNRLLMTLGTQIIGATADVSAARWLSERFFRPNPWEVKHWRKVRATFEGISEVVDQEPQFMPEDEQIGQNANKFLTVEAFTFYVGIAKREGQQATSVKLTSLAEYDQGTFPRSERVEPVKDILAARHGQNVTDILRQIDARRPRETGGNGTVPSPEVTGPTPSPLPFQQSVQVPKTRRLPPNDQSV